MGGRCGAGRVVSSSTRRDRVLVLQTDYLHSDSAPLVREDHMRESYPNAGLVSDQDVSGFHPDVYVSMSRLFTQMSHQKSQKFSPPAALGRLRCLCLNVKEPDSDVNPKVTKFFVSGGRWPPEMSTALSSLGFEHLMLFDIYDNS